ncbi:MAG TPA: GNAT family N-acetyltransferase [Nitrososphaerales archaeon]|nr:GNAT family N-acetyltransferase [Nitrososphaerales archaeon]
MVRADGEVKSHLGLFDTPEAIYANLSGELAYAEGLISLVPSKGVLTAPVEFRELIENRLKADAVFLNDYMEVKRGEEKISNEYSATRLTRKEENEYLTFGSSFNLPELPIEWIREGLDDSLVFGMFVEGKLASVASLAAWLPQVSIIMGVETKPEYRRRGLGTSVVSATVKEGLKRSDSCGLYVRSNNEKAIALYESLGFKKIGEELWFDFGTGMNP